MNLEGGKLLCQTEGKSNHDCSGYCRQYLFSFEVVLVLIMIHPCRALSGVTVGTKKDEDKSNFIFLIGSGMSD